MADACGQAPLRCSKGLQWTVIHCFRGRRSSPGSRNSILALRFPPQKISMKSTGRNWLPWFRPALAPTGKARVRLQQATGFEARTIAQFLRPARYKEATQTYHVIGDVERVSSYKTVIVDESSMLTEDQLAALLDALGGVDRIILVG